MGCLQETAKGLLQKGLSQYVNEYQQVFQSIYLFGAFSPITGDHFELEMPHCNTEMFQIFLDHFSEILPDELKIMLLYNGAFHKSNGLVIPDNIVLLFIPP